MPRKKTNSGPAKKAAKTAARKRQNHRNRADVEVPPAGSTVVAEVESAVPGLSPETSEAIVEPAPLWNPPGLQVEGQPDELLFEFPDVNPYDPAELAKVKLPKEAGPKLEEIDPQAPMVEFLSDLPFLIKKRQTIDGFIDMLEGQKKEVSASIYANLDIAGFDKVVVGCFQAVRVIPEKPQERLDKDKLKVQLLKHLTTDQIAECFEAATDKGPPKEPYLLVQDLRKEQGSRG